MTGLRAASLVALAAACGLPAPAEAANRSATFNARMTINAGCKVASGDLVFAPTATLTGTETANATVSVTCTPGTFWYISFAIGAFSTTATGVMSGVTPGNTDTINYSMQLQGFPFGFGTGGAQTNNLRGHITSTGSKNADNYIQARTLYVNF